MALESIMPTLKCARILALGLIVALVGLDAEPGFAQQITAPMAPLAGSPFSAPIKPAALTAAPKMVAVPNDPADSNWGAANNAYAMAAALRAKGDKQGACNQIQAATTSLAKVKAAHSHSQDMLSKAKARFCGT